MKFITQKLKIWLLRAIPLLLILAKITIVGGDPKTEVPTGP